MAKRKRGYLASEARKAASAMRPDKVLARFFSGGKYQTWGAICRAVARTVLGLGVQGGARVPMRPVPPGSPLPTTKAAAQRARAGAAQGKKTAAKKQPSAYEAAAAIPARNRAAAKKTAASTAAARKPGARKAATGSVQVPKRNPDGTLDGSVSFPTFGPAEQAAYERALRGQVDPRQQVRQPRWPR